MKTRVFSWTIIGMLVLMAFPAFAGGSTEIGVTEDSIKIGTFQALSGPVAVIGKPVTDGLRAYFNYVNARGGVYGRKIDLIVADDQFNPANTVVEVQRLIEGDQVFALLAGLGTPGNLAVMDDINAQGIPYLYQGSGSSKLAFPPKKYIFPVQPNFTVEGNIMARFLTEKLDSKRIAVVYVNNEIGQESSTGLLTTLARYDGVEVVADIPIAATATDFTDEIQELQEAGPDAIVVALVNPQTANFIKQARGDYGITEPDYITTYPNTDITVINGIGPDLAEGIYGMAWLDVDFTDQDFLPFKIWQETFGEDSLPNAFATAGLVAAEMMVAALEKNGPDLTRESFVKTLEGFDSWSGELAQNITYRPWSSDDPNCRVGYTSMQVLKVEDGTWVKFSDWIQFAE